mmetsp:Transcript_20694/g.25608  ORF Transcript_20694/g.25608 Transcript_20694/m.25608 type:complete len:159 (+) Transcript_20694:191-667(+)|eukprot:CAMPEP_0172504678 /NCGR_PEP_ID=MMETSP1066-20121228/180457_1 /TAXON_ID=671091 /ORGANISM="Coscinodiscus wailesii, Strain CCMP2513" /LENGTH=158 /DNA_ID=CAMNT_0013280953 /DNA_START=187 /DNA_END=663 /DNA_ORIENTATION=-
MASATLMMRTVARRSFITALHTNASAPCVTSARCMSTYYTKAHEYIKVEGNVGTVGITDHAQSLLGDIVFVDLPEVDDEFDKGDSFGSVESVKAASDVYAPVTGTVTETNEAVTSEPGTVNSSAEDEGWFIKMEIGDESELEDLMNAEDYKAHCEAED